MTSSGFIVLAGNESGKKFFENIKIRSVNEVELIIFKNETNIKLPYKKIFYSIIYLSIHE